MKKMALILLFGLCVFNVEAQNTAQGGVYYNDVSIRRSRDSVEISFGVMTGVQSVGRGEQLILTPVLYNAARAISLPTIAVQSRRVEWQEFRAGGPSISLTPAYRMPNGAKIAYSAKIPYDSTFTNVLLRVDQAQGGCARMLPLACVALTDRAALTPPPPYVPEPRPLVDYAFSLQINSGADSLAQQYPFVAPLADFERRSELPQNEFFHPDMPLNMGGSAAEQQQDKEAQFIAANEKGAMQIDFERNGTRISRYYKDNNLSLVTLVSVLKKIEQSEDAHVTKIIVAGFASPEGPLANNDRLAWGRAVAVRDFIRANSVVPQDAIQLYNGSEDWRGLRRMVLDSDMEHKEKLVEIIDRVSVLKGREKQLMDVAGGIPYRYMTKHFFPKLRNAAYIKVYYEASPEVTTLAENFRQVLTRMESGAYAQALELLAALPSLPEGGVENLTGVCHMMMGNRVKADECFRQAAAKGNADAKRNLEQSTADMQGAQGT